MQQTEILTRKVLYDMVWSTPLTVLSRKYDLSDNGLRKICIRMQIPLPPAGHWMRLQFNKKITVPTLPGGYTGEETVALPLRGEGEPVTIADPVKTLAAKFRKDSSLSFDVPDRLHTKNPLILTARERLTGKETYGSHGVISCFRDELDIKIGTDNVSRMLRFADKLLKLITSRGHEVTVSLMDTYAVANGQKLKILFREKLKRHMVKGTHYDTQELHPTGILVFRVDGFYGKEWKDGKEKLEYYLPDILAYLEIESHRRNEREKERRKERLEWEHKEELKKQWQARKQKDVSDFINTLQKAERWHKAVNLRNYIAQMEASGKATNEWLEWARKKADWYDPFMETEDELLGDINRDTLKQENQRSW